MRLGRREPVLITSATEPRNEEIRRRQRRYVLSMLFRTVCFVLAVVAFDGVARFVAILIALVLPWVAVVVANGGPPPHRTSPALFTARAAEDAPQPALEPGRHPVVDGVVDDDDGDGDGGDGDGDEARDASPPPPPPPP